MYVCVCVCGGGVYVCVCVCVCVRETQREMGRWECGGGRLWDHVEEGRFLYA